MKSKVFGIGLSRTGTTTLYKLLVELGYDCRHSSGSMIANDDSDLMESCDALVDSPVPLLYRELDRRYPNSKFILTTRDKEPWLQSMQWMFTHGKVNWDWRKPVQAYHKRFYGTTTFDRATLSTHFDAFHEQVRTHFRDRPGDLLVIDIDHGGFDIAALCDFLGVPRRSIDIPRANQRRYAGLGARLQYRVKEILGLR